MDLYILRHAIAVERGTAGSKTDFERSLTPDGEQKLRRVVKAMRNLELNFDLVLSSPYVRARETAQIVAAGLSLKKLETCDSLAPDGNLREFIFELKKRDPAPKSLLVVGHEPCLSMLIGMLVCGSTKARIALKKAGLCRLTVDVLRPGRCAQLDWLLAPRQMLLMT
jgi:phosphohistidine phosphatase